MASIQRLQLGASALTRVLLWGLVNWWADVGCLAFAMLATGITGLSAGKILLVWTAGAGAASLSPTPAGIGAVEVAMVAALTIAGVNGPHAVTAILVYRAISLKGASPSGHCSIGMSTSADDAPRKAEPRGRPALTDRADGLIRPPRPERDQLLQPGHPRAHPNPAADTGRTQAMDKRIPGGGFAGPRCRLNAQNRRI